MKVLSVKQPWATLLALGLKLIETRSWATNHRGETGIHASKKIDKKACRTEPINSVLAAHGYNEHNLPTGCIISIGNLIGCYEIGKCDDFQKEAEFPWVDRFIWGNEYELGWYEEGRVGWEIADMKQIEHIPAKGQLGLWTYRGLNEVE